MDENNTNNGSLIAVSSRLLYEGMEVLDDIYNYDATHLLIRRGTKLSDDSIGKIKNLNSGKDTIYVTSGTQRTLLEKSQHTQHPSRTEMEQITGYAAAKDKTVELLDGIANNKVLQQEGLRSVSAELSNRLEVTSPSTILSLINALAPVDEYLQRHCINVSLLNGLIGRWLGLPAGDVDTLVLIGLLHDCGKALVPPQVLNAPRMLTGVEFEVIKMHAVYSYDLLGEFPEHVRRAARCHHEKVSGAGYPDRLQYKDLSIEARITAVSDIYDAVVSQRAYKKPRSPFSTMAMLAELRDTDLDAEIVNTFNKYMPQELIEKSVMMSDGSIGIIREFDSDDIEYPIIEVNGTTIKSGKNLYCTSMYTEE